MVFRDELHKLGEWSCIFGHELYELRGTEDASTHCSDGEDESSGQSDAMAELLVRARSAKASYVALAR